MYLCSVWLVYPEPYNKPEQPGSTPPSGNESFLALVSGCQCGCGLLWAKLTGLVSLWCPAAGAGRVKEPRLEHRAPCMSTNTKTSAHIIIILTRQEVKEHRRILRMNSQLFRRTAATVHYFRCEAPEVFCGRRNSIILPLALGGPVFIFG